jgi:hypothetical protein
MKTAAAVAIVLGLAAAPVAAQQVHIDYNPTADFGSYHTFAWHDTPTISIYDENPLNHSRIKHGVEYYLIKAGMVEDTEDPDLYVTYYGEVDSDFEVNTLAAAGYNIPTDWEWDPYWGNAAGTQTTTSTIRKAGTVVIDIWDARTSKMVWRGTMSAVLDDNPKKTAKKIEKGIKKMVEKWQKLRAKDPLLN